MFRDMPGWRLACFLAGLVLIFTGVMILYGHSQLPGWAQGVGVWSLLIGILDVLITQPWK